MFTVTTDVLRGTTVTDVTLGYPTGKCKLINI